MKVVNEPEVEVNDDFTPKELLFRVMQENSDEFEHLVISIKDKNGQIRMYNSTMTNSDLHFHGGFIARCAMDYSIG